MTSDGRDNFDDLPILAELRERLERHFADDKDRPSLVARARPGFRYASVALAAAVAVAVAVLALALGGHRHAASTAGGGGSRGALPQEVTYIRAAAKKARQTGACGTPKTTLIPAVSNKAPTESLLGELSVLRRPATAADRLPRGLATVGGGARGVYDRYIQRARVTDGISYYIVPARSVSPPLPAVSAGCVAAMGLALDQNLRHAPVKLRAPTRRMFAQLIARDRALRITDSGGGICLAFAKDGSTGGSCGETATEIERQGLISVVGPLAGVVPDGVASVTVRYQTKSGQMRTATSDVVGNVFVFLLRSLPTVGHSLRVHRWPMLIWRSEQGTILRVVSTNRSIGLSSAFCNAASANNICGR